MPKVRTEAETAWLTMYFEHMGCRLDGDEIIDVETGEHVATLRKVRWNKNRDGAQVEISAHSPFRCLKRGLLT